MPQALFDTDDIIMFSSTVQERLGEVFECLRSARLKCHLFRRSVDYLGYVISKQGAQTDPGKTKIKVLPIGEPPTTSRSCDNF